MRANHDQGRAGFDAHLRSFGNGEVSTAPLADHRPAAFAQFNSPGELIGQRAVRRTPKFHQIHPPPTDADLPPAD
ncbi:MAG: hypothetical protein R3F40_05695 [Candidatus Competibacteraceae bacterium]